MRSTHLRLFAPALFAGLAACGQTGQEVGEFKNDLLGNEIKVVRLVDPKVEGVVCHLTHFDRGFWDRLGKGNWFEDPSNSAIACYRSGPIRLDRVRSGAAGEEVFSTRQSLFFKNVAVRRILDEQAGALLYVSHAREMVEGSAKMTITTVALTEEDRLANGLASLAEATSGEVILGEPEPEASTP